MLMTLIVAPMPGTPTGVFVTGQSTTDYVKACLLNGGYDVQFLSARFHGFSAATGRQVHLITYYNDDGELEDGEVFINAKGVADF